MASRSPSDLCPEMRVKYVEFMHQAKLAGVDVLVYCTYRPDWEQLELYAQGRTKPGKVVTWTKHSKHNIEDAKGNPAAEAWDCVPLIMGKPRWDAKAQYLKLAEIGKRIGLIWGGDWDQDGVPFERGEYDSPHFELVR